MPDDATLYHLSIASVPARHPFVIKFGYVQLHTSFLCVVSFDRCKNRKWKIGGFRVSVDQPGLLSRDSGAWLLVHQPGALAGQLR